MMSNPLVKEYESGMSLINDVKQLETKGVSQDNIYVLAHEEGRTKQVADKADINTIGLKEQGLGTSLKNVFQSTGDELRNKMEEVGLSQMEAKEYEEKLDEGKILLIVKDYDKNSELL
ncbi:general stress protein [Bacillus taeanensis]|uniref:General stress protein n=2 Tax=Bacillus taeanensis TaxID=273032 RepID=A0A366XZ97_9BACI|nr:general stress protein [Bacillus taeanensis]RBW70926.1 general stress protein [Bacillus taeanensis]